ncbi:hypothetical protein SBRY_20348 [Actinacidiphila bryophytorum]|uniref:Uncharacterized protein n=1 Tax=Actinacidiphila bryophytorum TaxID=1436133 RepID=A0A9W4EDQ1_9ACTN|nr:hypothetical protein SBRY_20348 [Actinacidiphila bryophytorum]
MTRDQGIGVLATGGISWLPTGLPLDGGGSAGCRVAPPAPR